MGLGRSLQIDLPIEEAYVPLRTTLARPFEPRGTERFPDQYAESHKDVDLGDVFREAHTRFFPDLETPAVSVGLGALGLQHILTQGGSGYFPVRVVQPLLDEGRLYQVEDAPSVERPAYVVYGETPSSPDLVKHALQGLREVSGGA